MAIKKANSVKKLKEQLAVMLKHNELLTDELMAAGTDSVDPFIWHDRGIVAALKALQDGITLRTPEDLGKDLSNLADLRIYVISCEATLRQIDLLNGAYEALEEASDELEAAHRLATAVEVEEPNEEETGAIVADLETLSDAIRGDENFSAALSLLEAAAEAYGG